MRVLGVDACRQGWVGIVLVDGAYDAAIIGEQLGDVVATADAMGRGSVRAVGVDIPLGAVAGGRRACDADARSFVTGLGSSVFPAPPRRVLALNSHATASQWCRQRYGFGLSAQSWALRMKITEAEALWARRPRRVYEVHPEVSFRVMADGDRDRHGASKRTWRGHHERLALLRAWGIVLPEDLGPAGAAGADDVADAAAAAWSAHHIAAGAGEHFTAERDEKRGKPPVTIWY